MTPRPRLARPLANGAALAVASIAYAAVAWLVGSPVATGEFRGSDWGNAVTIATWLARQFPAMPFWYPYQGGGVSFTAGYAVWPIEWSVALSRLTALDVTAAMRALAFLAVPLGATGCFLLARSLRLGAVAAFLAGLLFVLSPANWNVFYRIGFFSNAIALGVAPWTIWALLAYARRETARLDRAGAATFVAAAGLAVIGVLAHPIVGAAVAAAAALSVVASGRPRARELGRLVAWAAACAALALGWGLAFALYTITADREGLNALDPSSAPVIPAANVLGLVDVRHGITDLMAVFTLPPAVWVLGTAGALVALRARATRGPAITALASLAVLTLDPVRDALYVALPPLSPLFAQRGPFAVDGALLPVLAAGLATAAGGAVGSRWRPLAAGVATALLVVGMIAGEGAGYGVWTASETPTLGARLADPLARAKLLAPPPPRVDASSLFLLPFAQHPRVAELLDTTVGRADLSPQLGGLLLGLDVATSARVVSLYTFQLSLIHEMWGDEQRELYLPPAYGIAEQPVSEVAAWHALNRVALRADPTLPARYRVAGWRLVDAENVYADVDVEVWESPTVTELAAARERGAILYVGSAARRSYTTFFRIAGGGALPFATAWPVESSGYVDDYGAAQLAQFDAIVLDGFGYHDRKKAYDLLEAYVRGGGSLFIDTGWQYVAADWEVAPPTPAVIALDRLAWRGLGPRPQLELRADPDGPAVGGLSAAELGDLTYGLGEWDVSTADATDLRAWAKPVLLADGHPLIAAGRLGKGRVVWSGLNLTNHIVTKQSPNERELFARLLRWLVPETDAPRELRARTDDAGAASVDVPAGARWLLWREPAAFASAASGGASLATYRAGPGYTLVALGAAGTVRIAHDLPAAVHAAGWLSDAAIVLLALWLAAALAAGGAADPGAAPAAIWGALRRRVRVAMLTGDEDT